MIVTTRMMQDMIIITRCALIAVPESTSPIVINMGRIDRFDKQNGSLAEMAMTCPREVFMTLFVCN